MNPVQRWFCVHTCDDTDKIDCVRYVVESVGYFISIKGKTLGTSERDRESVWGTQYWMQNRWIENVILMMCNLLCCRWDRQWHTHTHTCEMRVNAWHSSAFTSMFSISSSYFNINTRFYICSSIWKIVGGKHCCFNFPPMCVVVAADADAAAVAVVVSRVRCAVNAVIYNKLLYTKQTSLSLFVLSVCRFSTTSTSTTKKCPSLLFSLSLLLICSFNARYLSHGTRISHSRSTIYSHGNYVNLIFWIFTITHFKSFIVCL